MTTTLTRRSAVLVAAAALATGAAVLGARPAGSVPGYGPPPPANPYLSTGPAATMHGDAESSDTVPGPGPAALTSRYLFEAAACPTVLLGSDGFPQVVCTTILGQTPTVQLLDPATGATLASHALAKGSLLGSIYSYLDAQDRLVTVDGNGLLQRIAHVRSGAGWTLRVDGAMSLSTVLPSGDSVVGLAPDWHGLIWFASSGGVVGTANPATGAVAAVRLGEGVANSISTSPTGTFVVSDHAIYALASVGGVPRVLWRAAYDRGTHRKPGQLSQGSGATPTVFGPVTGDEYVAITDNADDREHLLVYRVGDGSLACELPLFTSGSSGTENSPIGLGRSVFVASTYGYPYPSVPAGAGPAVPSSAPEAGGLVRIDLTPAGCAQVWSSSIRSAAVPKLSVADGLLYTTTRTGLLDPAQTSLLDTYREVVLDAGTGNVLRTSYLGNSALVDTLQMAGAVDRHRVLWQGTLTGILRIG